MGFYLQLKKSLYLLKDSLLCLWSWGVCNLALVVNYSKTWGLEGEFIYTCILDISLDELFYNLFLISKI